MAQLHTKPNVMVDQGMRAASPGEYRGLLKDNAPDIETRAMLDQLLTVIQDISGSSSFLTTGNEARLLIDGPGTFKAIFGDIDQARDHIHLETYILEDDVIGQALADHLIASRQRGVQVRVLIDAYGSLNLPEAYIERLRKHGIELHKFHPVNPTEDMRLWRSNNRNHRKILVIDGQIAYTGGINFSDVYSKGSFPGNQTRDGDATDGAWRDTHVRIVGPVVHQFQQQFLKLWNNDLPEDAQLDDTVFFPEVEDQGDMLAGVIASTGGNEVESDIYSILAAAIGHAQQRLWVTQAYFAPDETFIEIIKTTAARGVDVRLLLPGVSDAPLVVQASRSSYQGLLEAGVRIYERTGSALHAKTFVVDGVWSTIGSTNFDYRSFVYNYELNAVIVSADFGSAMEKLFEVDLQQADEITLKAWRRRPLTQRLKEGIGSILRRWL